MAEKKDPVVETPRRSLPVRDGNSFFWGFVSALGLVLTILFINHLTCPPRMHNWAPGSDFGYHQNHDRFMTETPNFYVEPKMRGLMYMMNDNSDGATAVTVS